MKTNTRRITVLMLDGEKHEFVATYMPLADRVAFEKKWGVAFEGLFRYTTVELEDPQAEGGTRKVTVPNAGPEWRDERGAFFIWRAMRRHGIEVAGFDQWLEQVDDIDIEPVDGPPAEPNASLIDAAPDGGLDPTDQDPPHGS